MAGASLHAPSPAGAPTQRAIDRLLTRLGRAEAWRVRPAGKADAAEGDGSELLRLVPASGTGRGAEAEAEAQAQAQGVVVSAALLRAARARDLVERCDRDSGALRMSQAGQARLRRISCGDDGFRRQHQHRGTRRQPGPDGSVALLAVDHGESPLAWLRNRKGPDGAALIDAARFEAGERLRADVTFGRIVPGLATQSWDGLGASGARRSAASGIADLSDAAVAARLRVDRALAAVGPELAPVLIDVCCELKGLGEVEKARRWPPRSAKVVLMMGLARLARHYGLMPPEDGRR
ncbi:DUF6456 domain-containing protein [Stappia stellulata]|uniref:DUF6456 domain-containing protein n=1 Tax=Stappia stellulata TaxID=71235 RepID=UPI001CD5C4DC|nr:DUF6456 domain-containing protein [Stappia stellulata]MCA1244610.1 DUF6456 domain-containing protein [Stappia stellulata]